MIIWNSYCHRCTILVPNLNRNCYFAPGRSTRYCDERVCILSVCLSAHISQRPPVQTLRKFLYILTVAVVRSSSDDNAIYLCHNASGFVDGVMFAHNGPYGAHWPLGAWLIRRILKVTHQGAAPGGEVWCLRLLCICTQSCVNDFDKHCVLLCNELNFVCCFQAF